MRIPVRGFMAIISISLIGNHHHEHRIKIEQAPVKGEVGVSEIHVSGPLGGRYEKAASTFPVWVGLGQPNEPNNPVSELPAKIWIDGELVDERDVDVRWDVLKYDVPYNGIPSTEVSNTRHDAVDKCNELLDSRSGAQRQEFMRKGGRWRYPHAIEARIEQKWVVSEGKIFGRSDLETKTFVDTAPITVTVVCKPLGGVTPVAKLPSLIKSLKLRAEPMGEINIGNQVCPRQVRLYGTIQTSRSTRLKSLMRGPKFLTPPTEVRFNGPETRSVLETYPIVWNNPKDQIASNAEPPTPMRQSVAFSLLVAQEDGTPLKQTSTTVNLACKVSKPARQMRVINN